MTYQMLSIEDGLLSNKQYHIMQDSKGYIWFGTSNGACRWDSKNFKYFTIENGLPNNEVFYIYEDSKGRIWFSTFSRELSYYYEGYIYNAASDPFLRKIDIAPCSKIIEVNRELYFVSFSGILKKYDIGLNEVSTSLTNKALTGQCLLNLRNKVWAVDYGQKNTSKLFSMNDSFSVNDQIQPNYPDADIITTIDYKSKTYAFRNGLDSPFYKSHFSSTDFKGALFNNGSPIEIYKDLLFFKRNSRYLKADYTGTPLIYLLKQHLFLITTGNLISCQQIPILKYDTPPGKDNNVKFLFKFKNDVYSVDAMARINNIETQKKITQLGGIIPYAYNFGVSNHTFYLTTPYRIYYFKDPNKTIHSLDCKEEYFKYVSHRIQPGEYLSAHGRSGADLFGLKNGYRKKLFANERSPVYSLFEDRSGRLWYASINKVFFTRIVKDTIQEIKEFVLESKIPVYCSQFVEDEIGNIFFVTNCGIYVYDGKVKYKIDNTNLLTDNECKKILIDSRDSSFWVCCRVGLNHIRYKRINGMLQFEVVNKFLETDGLYSNGINDVLLDSNKLYIATEKGVNVLEDLNYRPVEQKIPMYIWLRAINGVDNKDSVQGNLQLWPDQNNLTLNFSALYFLRRNRLKVIAYLFRNKELISRSEITEDKIDYYSLNDGNYRVLLYAYDRDYPYIHGRTIPYYFTIHLPYYKSWWFIISVSCLFIITTTALLLKSLVRRKRLALERAELNTRLNESNLKSLQNQMNPHFVFNSLNTIQSFIMDKNERAAIDHLADFSELMREMLIQSTQATISLENEIHFLKRYVQIEMIRFNYAFEVLWDVRVDDDDIADVYIPTMLIQPVIENAIKHGMSCIIGKKGEIVITFHLAAENQLQVTVKDNGNAAMAGQNKGNSIAVQTIKDRLDIYSKNGLKGEYHLKMTENGATATIFIPI